MGGWQSGAVGGLVVSAVWEGGDVGGRRRMWALALSFLYTNILRGK